MPSNSAALDEVRHLAARCERCELYRCGTQTVFGAGDVPADVMLVGEQPGDQEDRKGQPFVGPAGRVLDEGLERAGLASRRLYATNAVKHFRWEPRGKRRIHKTPGVEHVRACHAWLVEELRLVEPTVLVLMGATAVGSMSRHHRVMRDRGQLLDLDGQPTVITVHPSSVLRSRERGAAMEAFVGDLEVVAAQLPELTRARR